VGVVSRKIVAGKYKYVLQYESVLLAGAVSKLTGFPVVNQFALGSGHDEGRYIEHLLSDALSPFAKMNVAAMSNKRHRSLCQELQGAAASNRRVLLSSKSTPGSVLDLKASDPIERHIAELFGRKRALPEELRMLIGEAGQAPADGVEPLPNLRRATKRVIVDWIATNWVIWQSVSQPSLQTNGLFRRFGARKGWRSRRDFKQRGSVTARVCSATAVFLCGDPCWLTEIVRVMVSFGRETEAYKLSPTPGDFVGKSL
jgi:hypothetical protein